MYKKIQEQITKQTRKEVGQVKRDKFSGMVSFPKQETRTIPPENTGNQYTWHTYSYTMNRAVILGRGIFSNLVPVLSNDLYSAFYPGYLEGTHFFVFGLVSEGDAQVSEFNAGTTGYFYHDSLPEKMNARYICPITVPSDSSERYTLPLTLESDGVSCSLWILNSSGAVCVYSSLLYGLKGSVNVNVSLQAGQNHLVLYFYNDSEGLRSITPVETNTFLKVNPNFDKMKLGYSAVKAFSTAVPVWDLDISSSSDPITGNIINTLSILSPTSDIWSEIEIYRQETYDYTIIDDYDTRYSRNLLLLDTTSSRFLSAGTKISVDSDYHNLQNIFVSPVDKVDNSNFSVYDADGVVDNWTKTALASAAASHFSSAYAYFGDYRSNGNCIRIDSRVTNTAKSVYIESEYIYVDTSDFVNFSIKKMYGADNSAVKLMYFSSSDGTAFDLDSAFLATSHGMSSLVDTWPIIKSPVMPVYLGLSTSGVNPVCCKLRIYNIYNSTSASSILIDDVFVGDVNSNYIYTPSANSVVVQTDARLTKPKNARTTFNAKYVDTTDSYNGITVSSAFGDFSYASTAWGDRIKFDNGLLFWNETTNYLIFSDYASTAAAKIIVYSGIDTFFRTEEDNLISTGYSTFTSSADKQLTIEKLWSWNPDFAPEDGSTFTVWAKSDTHQDMILGHGHTSFASETFAIYHATSRFTLTSEWNKYSLYASTTNVDVTFGYSTIRLDSGSGGYISIAGGTLEKSSAYNIHYVCNDTVDYVHTTNALKYDTTGAIDSNFGAIRMWYTPLFDYNISSAIPLQNYLFYYGTANANISISYYSHEGRFSLTQNDDVVTRNCDVYIYSTSLGANTADGFNKYEPIHIVATWDTSKSLLYVNNVVSSSSANGVVNVSSSSFWVGNRDGYSTPYAANGIIQDFRIDKCYWSQEDVSTDYYSQKEMYDSSDGIVQTKNILVGSKKINLFEPGLTFIDDIGLEPNKEYSYVFRTVDENGIRSDFSSAQSITTNKRKPFEKLFNKNLFPNSAFEVFKSNGDIYYWGTSDATLGGYVPITSTSGYCFFGTKSMKVGGYTSNDLVAQYLPINDTSHTISCYFSTAGTDSFAIRIRIYNDLYEQITPWGIGGQKDYQDTEFTTSGAIGVDGRRWVRFSTAFTIGVDSAAFATFRIGTNGGTEDFGYFDAAQLEEGVLTDYVETPFIEKANILYDSISADRIKFDSILGKHFRGQEVLVNYTESGTNRIVIGVEEQDQSYAILEASAFSWHSPNLSTGKAWNYTKHVESGVATFGETITFSERYTNFSGGDPLRGPIVSVIPKNIKSYVSTAIYSENTWSFLSPTSGDAHFYVGGYYLFAGASDDFNPIKSFGTQYVSYGAHFMIVTGEVPASEVVLRVQGFSITDAGVREDAVEYITIPASTLQHSYFETTKTWIGWVTIDIHTGTTEAILCDYGFCKYWSNDHKDFSLVGFDCTWLGGATDADADIHIHHHRSTGWAYTGTGPTFPEMIYSLQGDYGDQHETEAGIPGAWYRTQLHYEVNASEQEGLIFGINNNSKKTFEIGNIVLRIST